jgi:uncharacterized metal-binding protein
MTSIEKLMIFLCSGAAKSGSKKLSYRIAAQLEQMGIGDIGNLENLSDQHAAPEGAQKRMIFINDCRSGCVNVLTHGFGKDKYLFLDVSPHLHSSVFDIDHYINSEILPKLAEKWSETSNSPGTGYQI